MRLVRAVGSRDSNSQTKNIIDLLLGVTGAHSLAIISFDHHWTVVEPGLSYVFVFIWCTLRIVQFWLPVALLLHTYWNESEATNQTELETEDYLHSFQLRTHAEITRFTISEFQIFMWAHAALRSGTVIHMLSQDS